MPAFSLDLRGLVPFALRVEFAPLRFLPKWLLERPDIARIRARHETTRALGPRARGATSLTTGRSQHDPAFRARPAPWFRAISDEDLRSAAVHSVTRGRA